MEIDRIWTIQHTVASDRIPVLAVALHNGHWVRDEVAALLAIREEDRLREEDPFTGEWTRVAPTRVIGLVSRFEVDLNRPRERALYRRPEDAWGLRVWRAPPSDALVQRSLEEYDAFYEGMVATLDMLRDRFTRFVVFDLHSYNHRRAGPAGPPSDSITDPQVNVGTGTMDRSRWASLIDRFIAELAVYPFPSGPLDVRENVKFRGGNLARWIHTRYAASACVLSIEVKKFFMDEWTGVPDRPMIAAVEAALAAVVPSVVDALDRL
jgi:N-formylglutamate amidohydrolase